MKQSKGRMKPKDDSGPQLIGYARVSTEDQSLQLQIDALNAAGCLNIYQEKISGAAKRRPQLDLAIKDLRPGDTLVVWRLDRFARSGSQLYKRLEEIQGAGASFKSLQENFDFSTTTGRFVLGILGLVAELERQLTIERTRAGMAAQKAKGTKMGAPVKLDDDAKRKAKAMLFQKERREVGGKIVWRLKYKKKQIAKKLGVSTGTIFAYQRELNQRK